MSSLSFFNYRFVLAFIISVCVGLMITSLFPLFYKNPRIMFGLPLAGAFFLMLVINPRLTFILLFISRPLLDVALNMTKVSVGGQDIGFGAILNLIVIVLAVFLYFYEGGFPRKNPVVFGWVVFLLVMLIAVFNSPYMGRAIRLYANYLSFFAMFLTPFLLIKRREDFIFWVKAFAWSFVFPVLYANWDLIKGGQFYEDAGMRIKGSFSHPNILAFYLCLGITYYFYLLKSRLIRIQSWIFIGFIGLMLNMGILLLATKTRNAWIACFFTFFVYGILRDRKTLGIMFLLLPLLVFVPSVQERVMTVFNGQSAVDYEGVNSFEWRIQMWTSSFPMIAKQPLLGYGLTSFKEMSPMFSREGTAMGAHNVYVETMFESGLFGLVGLIILFFQPIRLFWTNLIRTRGKEVSLLWAIAFAYLLSYVLICFADNLSYYLVFNWYVWFFVGLLVIAQRYLSADSRN